MPGKKEIKYQTEISVKNEDGSSTTKYYTATADKLETLKSLRSDYNEKLANHEISQYKTLLNLSNNNIKIFEFISMELQNEENSAIRNSVAGKDLVKNLLLTRNDAIVKELSRDCNFFEHDEENFKILAGLKKEIRNKELQGIKLSDNEIELKRMYDDNITYKSYKIGDNTSEISSDGEIFYRKIFNGFSVSATNVKLLEEFGKKYEAATTDEAKTKLF